MQKSASSLGIKAQAGWYDIWRKKHLQFPNYIAIYHQQSPYNEVVESMNQTTRDHIQKA